jgi:hypothetical protein
MKDPANQRARSRSGGCWMPSKVLQLLGIKNLDGSHPVRSHTSPLHHPLRAFLRPPFSPPRYPKAPITAGPTVTFPLHVHLGNYSVAWSAHLSFRVQLFARHSTPWSRPQPLTQELRSPATNTLSPLHRPLALSGRLLCLDACWTWRLIQE